MTRLNFIPALGITSVVPLPSKSASPSSRLHFSCTLDDAGDEGTPEIWTNLPHQNWHAVPFTRSGWTRDHFVASIPLEGAHPGAFEYTFRVRHTDEQLEWLGSEGSNGRIELVAREHAAGSNKLSCPFDFGIGAHIDSHDNSALIKYQLEDGVSGDAQDFELTPKGGDEEPDWTSANGLVIERSERIWYQPRILKSSNPISDVSPQYETQMLYLRAAASAKHHRSRIVVLLPFSTRSVSSSIFGRDGTVLLRATRDCSDHGAEGHLAVAWGHDGEMKSLLDRCVELAKGVLSSEYDQLSTPAAAAKASPTIDSLDGLSACTWNALDYERYHLSDVIPWLEGLKDPKRSSKLFAGSLENVLLDDGWQDTVWYKDTVDGKTDRRALRSFGVRPEWYDIKSGKISSEVTNFSSPTQDSGDATAADEKAVHDQPQAVTTLTGNGELADAISRIKAMGVKRVGVWMTVAGYWDGILPTGVIAQRYGPAPLPMWKLDSQVFDSARTTWHLPPRSALEDYYRTYFSTLKSAGVDFVKVDDQAHQDYMQNIDDTNEGDAGQMKQDMLRVMRSVSDDVFGVGTTIHCMAGSPRIWGGVGFAPMQPKSIIRASDDFFPDQDDSHRWHIFVNTHNTLLLRSLDLVPDFDMAQAGHPWGSYHIPLRAFTPSATYSTDLPSTGDALALWDPMLARTKPGDKIKLLKPRAEIGAVLEGRIAQSDTRGSGDGEALMVGLALPDSTGGHIGLWNCRASDTGIARSTLDARDVFDVVGTNGESSSGFVVHLDGQISCLFTSDEINSAAAAQRLLVAPGAHVRLEPKGVKIVTVSKLHRLRRSADTECEGGTNGKSNATVEIACLGLLDKHVGLAAISSIHVKGRSSESKIARVSSSSVTRPPVRLLSGLSTFPRPTASRLAAILLSHGLSPFRATAAGSSSSWPNNSTSARSLARDLWRRPIATVWSEARALVGFTLAVVLWSVGQMRNVVKAAPLPAPVRQRQQPPSEQAMATGEGKDKMGVTSSSSQVLAIELIAVSERLGFYVAGQVRASSVQCTLDGHRIDPRYIKDGTSEGLIEVDVEGAWDAIRDGEEGSSAEDETWWLEIEALA